MKVPWLSKAIKYRKINDLWYEAVSEIEIVMVREIQNDLKVKSLCKKTNLMQAFIEKLTKCPFIILDDQECSNSKETLQWNKEEYVTIESCILFENSNVHMNFYSSIDNYITDVQVSSMFCRSMFLPKFITKQDLPYLQNQRSCILDKQIADWRIIYNCNDSIIVCGAVDMVSKNCL